MPGMHASFQLVWRIAVRRMTHMTRAASSALLVDGLLL